MEIHKVLHVHKGTYDFILQIPSPSGPTAFLKSVTEQNKGNC